ncbi:MAG: SCP2 sterol-binding domain-containing protein [Micromonosporaceae bacterium]
MSSVFRPDRAKNLDAVLHWNVGDRPDGGVDTYELVIAQGQCRLSAKPEHAPRLTLTIGAVDLLRMVTGNANPLLLFMRGRLRASGDRALVTKVPGLFEVPKP